METKCDRHFITETPPNPNHPQNRSRESDVPWWNSLFINEELGGTLKNAFYLETSMILRTGIIELMKEPHTHSFDEYLLFHGTDPDDVFDLGERSSSGWVTRNTRSPELALFLLRRVCLATRCSFTEWTDPSCSSRSETASDTSLKATRWRRNPENTSWRRTGLGHDRPSPAPGLELSEPALDSSLEPIRQNHGEAKTDGGPREPALQDGLGWQTPTPTAPTTSTTVPNLSYGSKGTAVATLQQKLVALSYQPGRTDGVFDWETRQAVITFQKAEGLSRDGSVGPQTWSRLLRPNTVIRVESA